MTVTNTQFNITEYPIRPNRAEVPYTPSVNTSISDKKEFQNRIILVGNISIFIIGLLRLFPRLILNNMAKLVEYSAKKHIQLPGIPQAQYLQNLLKDRKVLDKKMVRLLGIALLLQSPLHFQTAFNANQPSMFLNEGLANCYRIGSLFTSNVVFRTVYSLISGLFAPSGKQNDIGNTRSMQDRREWDLTRLRSLLSHHGFKWDSMFLNFIKEELSSFAKYIKSDLQTALSFKPWKELARTYKQKNIWLELSKKTSGWNRILISQTYRLSLAW